MKNIFAYTALGPSPAYCSINEDEQGVVIVTVRAKDGRESSVEIPKAEAALLQQGEPEGFVRVPKAALDWLNGSGPDHEGKWFGEVEDALPQSKHPRKYFWRSHFRKICNAITGALLNAKCVLNSAAPEQHGKDRG